ncbi:MAG TPA: hypothetical protein VMR70_00415 [Flavisolibacter sp.]|nr:hypothetical protein [Flavisolibacter sp.]
MKKFNRGTLVILPVLFLLTALAPSCKKGSDSVDVDEKSLAHTKKHSAEVAMEWFNLLTEISRTKPYFSPQALRIFAYSGVTLYESVVPGMPSYQSIYGHLTGKAFGFDKKKDYYWPACANAAMARIASKIMEDYPTPNLGPLQQLETSLNASFAQKTTPEQLNLSNEFGRKVADAIYEWSRTDGALDACPTYVPGSTPGSWVPTPPGFLPVAGACQGAIKTFIPNIVTTAMAAPPPAYSTDPTSTFYLAAKETFESRNDITAEETKVFNNWRDGAPNFNPLAHMLRITTGIINKEKVNLEDASVLYAKQTMAASDVIAATFKSKFQYALLRPVTYIQNVMGKTTWNSLPVTPQTPSYPDESSATASSIAILEKYFGTNYSFVDSTHKSTVGEWTYPSFNAMMQDIVQARINGGTIFRFAGQAGITQGRLVGDRIDQLPFKK